MSQDIMINNIKKAEKRISETEELMQKAKMRQYYHFMPQQGWLNDPNGLIFYQGKYHFFYQYNPYDAFWGAMHWGHAVSEDLLHWEYLPVALAPSEPYDNHKEGGCFSGSSIEHDGKLYLFYTGTTNYGDGFVQTQCMAFSEDGIHFKKYKKNPIIEAPQGYEKANFRDPKVWKHNEYFYLICGAKKDNLAKALLYRSKDLKEWEYVNVLAESRGDLGYMWECPDFYPLGDKYVLMFSPMGLHERTTVYLVGDMDYETGKFHYHNTGEIDWGFDFYAPQSFLDAKGRRLIVGWANAWDWMPWWKDWGPSYKEGWCGSFNIPREVKLCEDNSLCFVPIEETQKLHEDECREENIRISQQKYEIKAGNGIAFELKAKIDLKKSSASRFTMHLKCSDMQSTKIIFDFEKAEMTFDRNGADGWSKGTTRSPLKADKEKYFDIHVLADQSSVEVFSNQYKTNHSCNVYTDDMHNKNYFTAEGGDIIITELQTWGMRNAMNEKSSN